VGRAPPAGSHPAGVSPSSRSTLAQILNEVLASFLQQGTLQASYQESKRVVDCVLMSEDLFREPISRESGCSSVGYRAHPSFDLLSRKGRNRLEALEFQGAVAVVILRAKERSYISIEIKHQRHSNRTYCRAGLPDEANTPERKPGWCRSSLAPGQLQKP